MLQDRIYRRLFDRPSKESRKCISQFTISGRPPQDVDVLAVLVLGRPNFFRKSTSSDVPVLVPVLVPDVLVQKNIKSCRPRTSSSPSWSSSWMSSSSDVPKIMKICRPRTSSSPSYSWSLTSSSSDVLQDGEDEDRPVPGRPVLRTPDMNKVM